MAKVNRKELISQMMNKLIKYSSTVSKYGSGEFNSDEEDYFRGNCERAYDTGIMDGKADVAHEILTFITQLNLDPTYTKKQRQAEKAEQLKAKKETTRLKKLNSPAAVKKAKREQEKKEKLAKKAAEKAEKERVKKEKEIAKMNDPKVIERKQKQAQKQTIAKVKAEVTSLKENLSAEKENKRTLRQEKITVTNKIKVETDSIEKKKLKHVLNAVKAKIVESDKLIKKFQEDITKKKNTNIVVNTPLTKLETTHTVSAAPVTSNEITRIGMSTKIQNELESKFNLNRTVISYSSFDIIKYSFKDSKIENPTIYINDNYKETRDKLNISFQWWIDDDYADERHIKSMVRTTNDYLEELIKRYPNNILSIEYASIDNMDRDGQFESSLVMKF